MREGGAEIMGGHNASLLSELMTRFPRVDRLLFCDKRSDSRGSTFTVENFTELSVDSMEHTHSLLSLSLSFSLHSYNEN